MYCRNCGSVVNDRAEVCIKCGCHPTNGSSYCQECGAVTNEKQEICVKCGCRLSCFVKAFSNILDDLAISENPGVSSNYDFRYLKPYYQAEFTKIQRSNEAYKGKWNWCAFLFGGIWAISKGCWLSFIVALAISLCTAGIGGVVYWFILGIRGNYIYYCHYVKHTQRII